MIGFAVCVGDEQVFERHAARSYARAAEPDSPLATLTADSSIHAVYNEALDHFAAVEELEALVLMHEDVELADPAFCARVREQLAADPQLAVLGTIGATGVRSLAWWEGEPHGFVTEPRGHLGRPLECAAVDAVDGMLLVLSPWAVRNLRFDEGYGGFHAYDVDVCFGARAAGRTVRAADLGVVHHTKGGFGDRSAWDRGDMRFRRKWGLPLIGPGPELVGTPSPDDRLRPQMTLVIALEDDPAAAGGCLASIAALDDEQPAHDVVLLVGERTPSLDPLLQQLVGDVLLARADLAGGLCGALVKVVPHCAGELVTVLHGMPRVAPGFLAPLCAALRDEAVAVAVAGRRAGEEPAVFAARRGDLSGLLPEAAQAPPGVPATTALVRALERFGTVAVAQAPTVTASR